MYCKDDQVSRPPDPCDLAKLTRPLLAANPPVLVYADGNFGQATPGRPRDLP
jgi:hypothetical protein